MTRGQLEVFLVMINCRAISPRFLFLVIKAGERNKPLIVVITHRPAGQETSDTHTVACDFDHSTRNMLLA